MSVEDLKDDLKGLSKTDLAVMLYLQTKSKVESLPKKDIISLLNPLTAKIQEAFEDFKDYIKDPEVLKPFDDGSLRSYLQMKYHINFPFSLSLFSGGNGALRKTILWWFNNYSLFDPDNISVPTVDSLNKSQRSVIENMNPKDLPKKKVTLLQIVNAGPGTGKTTTANTLAYHLRSEGVLLISYTNESIRENNKRFFDYPESKTYVGLKKYKDNPINLITVDSLAARIIGDSSDKNFDETIQMASLRIDPMKFVHPTRVRIYNHIIVDECQDIDDLRGNFILNFCQKIGIKSLTLFGDPRQKIRSNCGKWYSDLWESTFDFAKNKHSEARFEPVFRVGLEQSYRFENKGVVDLVNSISSLRTTLHVELKAKSESHNMVSPINILTLDRLNNVLDNLLSVSSNESAYSTSCIIGPSIEADNKTTNVGRRIASIFRAHGKAISFRTEGAFQPDSIPFLTIHSVKGREFDTVFIFGMNNYPANFPMIPHDEAMSLIFVAHSRARRRIFYIDGSDNGNFQLPLGVNPSFVDSKVYEGTIQASSQDFDKLNAQEMRHFNVSALVEDHSFTRFLEENRYTVSILEDFYKLSDWKIMVKPKEISSEQWGFIIGFDYQSQLTSYSNMYNFYFEDILTGNYTIMSEDIIVTMLIEGKIINNRLGNGTLVVSRGVPPAYIEILSSVAPSGAKGYSPATILWGYSKIYKNEEIDLYLLREILPDNVYLCGSKILTEALAGGGKAEFSVSEKTLHGRCDYIDSSVNVYELKTGKASKEYSSMLQVWLYHVLLSKDNASAHIVDCTQGHVYEVVSSESIYRWRYILKCYFTLRHHVDLTTSRRNYYISYGNPEEINRVSKAGLRLKENAYTVDTEFFGKDIFEIALVNLKDPYRTIVDLIKPETLEGMFFALDWLPDTQTEMYKSSIGALRLKFTVGVSKNKENPSLGYYVAGTDVEWCSRPGVNKIDLSISARAIAETKGCFTAGNFGPKLGELYTILAPFPLEYQDHLTAHTALSDALMLYELVHLGLINM
jgi:hypothetical protein